jgi:hypothetical protein
MATLFHAIICITPHSGNFNPGIRHCTSVATAMLRGDSGQFTSGIAEFFK